MNEEEKIHELSAGLQVSKINDESQKVFKKASSNQLLTLYLGSREIEIKQDCPSVISGIVYIDPKVMEMSQKVFCQLTLTFRYGREDEEVMGLKFCNEVIIALKQIWPSVTSENNLSPLQEILIERLGPNSVPFGIEIEKEIPSSVQLLPAKRYTGSPIGTSYDIRVYAVSNNDVIDEKIQKRYTVRLGVRLIHKFCAETELLKRELFDSNQQSGIPRLKMKLLSPKARKLIKQTSLIIQRANSTTKNISYDAEQTNKSEVDIECTKGPSIQMEKPFLWTEGKINLKASLDKKIYMHGENVNLTLELRNDSRKIVRKIRIFLVQYVDVCMFSNGKFKNIVAEVEVNEIIAPTQSFHGTYSLLPLRGVTKNWIAVEGALFSSSHHDASLEALNSKLASSTPQSAMQFSTRHHQQKNSFYEQRRLPFRHNTISHADEEETSGSGCIKNTTERNVFSIQVSYYAKIKLCFNSIGGDISLKLPFLLGSNSQEQEKKENVTQVPPVQKDNENNSKKCITQASTEYNFTEMTEQLNEMGQSSDSSASDLNVKLSDGKQENIVEAQIHERKYLESDM